MTGYSQNSLFEAPTVCSQLYLPTDEEVQRYGNMACAFHRMCHDEPVLNRCIIATICCARAYHLSIPELRSHARQFWVGEDRQKMMAFSRTIRHGDECRNTLNGIARAFNRTRATVIHAEHRYGAQIAVILGGRP